MVLGIIVPEDISIGALSDSLSVYMLCCHSTGWLGGTWLMQPPSHLRSKS
jgi:hypothetical protein